MDFILFCFFYNIRYYVFYFGRLDLKVIILDGLIMLGWWILDVSFVFFFVIIFVVIVFDGIVYVVGDDDIY